MLCLFYYISRSEHWTSIYSDENGSNMLIRGFKNAAQWEKPCLVLTKA